MRKDLRQARGTFSLRWLDISKSRWIAGGKVPGGKRIPLKPPGDGHWVAVLREVSSKRSGN